jgi:hypothetical protein
MKNAAWLLVFSFFYACGGSGSSPGAEEKKQQMMRVDSLWSTFREVKELLRFDMFTISARRDEMDSLLRISKFFRAEDLSDDEKSLLTQYHGIYRVYKPTAPAYKRIVIGTEEIFFRIKAMERSVENGTYLNKRIEFMETYNQERVVLSEHLENTRNTLDKLREVEPAYQRIEADIEQLFERMQGKPGILDAP